jgi:hypothetical protein
VACAALGLDVLLAGLEPVKENDQVALLNVNSEREGAHDGFMFRQYISATDQR